MYIMGHRRGGTLRVRLASWASSEADLHLDGGVVSQLMRFSMPTGLKRAVKGGGFLSFGFGGGLG